MSTRPYKDEFRIHPSEREALPEYLIEHVDRLHAELSNGSQWSCELEIAQEPHHYSIRLSSSRLTISTSLNGETDTVSIDADDFDERGGIGDILMSMVEGGALPADLDPHDLSISEGLI